MCLMPITREKCALLPQQVERNTLLFGSSSTQYSEELWTQDSILFLSYCGIDSLNLIYESVVFWLAPSKHVLFFIIFILASLLGACFGERRTGCTTSCSAQSFFHLGLVVVCIQEDNLAHAAHYVTEVAPHMNDKERAELRKNWPAELQSMRITAPTTCREVYFRSPSGRRAGKWIIQSARQTFPNSGFLPASTSNVLEKTKLGLALTNALLLCWRNCLLR